MPAVLSKALITTDAVGGVWQYSLELAAGIAARGSRVVLAAMGPRPTPEQVASATALPGVELLVVDQPLDWLADHPAQLQDAATELASLARSRGAQVIHLHTPALVQQASWPAPVVAVAHSCVGTWWDTVRGTTLPADLQWRADAVAAGLACADAVIAPSHAFASTLRRFYAVHRPIHVIHNGRHWPDAAGMPARQRQVLTAGRLWDEAKNLAALDNAAALLDHPVYAAGPAAGPNGACISLSHIHHLGCLSDDALATSYRRAAVFVSTAVYEPFGLSVLEAAQAGCALVLSDIPTFRELWDSACLFVDPTNPRDISAAIADILDTDGQQALWGRLSQSRARAYGTQRMAAETVTLHNALFDAGRALTAASR